VSGSISATLIASSTRTADVSRRQASQVRGTGRATWASASVAWPSGLVLPDLQTHSAPRP
jgi:hypothetical protein